MKKVAKVVLFTIVILIIVGSIVFSRANSASSVPAVNSTSQNLTQPVITAGSKITSDELASHNSKADCWVAYKGKVYDVTSWLPDHPGSADAIAPYCGNSSKFEAAFTSQHGVTQAERLTQEGTYKGDLQ